MNHPGWHIERGRVEDYDDLGVFHYRAGRPATVARWADTGAPCVLRAVSDEGRIGVLVVSMPTLNAAWRRLAWPDRYNTPNKRLNARRLNDEVRCVSRVVVDPRWRGMGVASSLVRAYLARPVTPATEALAAMGGAAPFFERAGMTAYTLPPARRDRRLLDAAEACGIASETLLEPRRVVRLARRRPLLDREYRVWARASRGTRANADGPLDRIASLALPAVAATLGSDRLAPRAYAHVVPSVASQASVA